MPWFYDQYRPVVKVPLAPRWRLYLARIFGEKKVGYDSGYKTTAYLWRGVLFVWRVKVDTLDD